MPKVSIEATLRGVPKGVSVIPRSQVKYPYRYTLQTRWEAGSSWSDDLSCNDWNTVVAQAEFKLTNTRVAPMVRIVDNGDPE